MSTTTKVTCDHCGNDGATISLLIGEGDPRTGVYPRSVVADLHICASCTVAMADFFPHTERERFAALSTYDETVELRSVKRAMPVPRDEVKAYPRHAVKIETRPQFEFTATRFEIERASDWLVNEFKIGKRYQFAQAGDVPGEVFAADVPASASVNHFDVCAVGMAIEILATYIGANPEGAHFVGKLIGKAKGFPPKKKD
jgi:hypothetical protein